MITEEILTERNAFVSINTKQILEQHDFIHKELYQKN
jgi:hypothetical protein